MNHKSAVNSESVGISPVCVCVYVCMYFCVCVCMCVRSVCVCIHTAELPCDSELN